MTSSSKTFSSQSIGLMLLVGVTTILTISLIPLWSSGELHYILHSNYERLRSYMITSTDATWCVMYDKPPRTGSTTILNALRRCWTSHHYDLRNRKRRKKLSSSSSSSSLSFVELSLEPGRREGMINRYYAIAGNHFSMTRNDIQLIRRRCTHLLYVTSTREMRGRIISRAKYELSKAKVNKNTTLSTRRMEKAMRRAIRKAEETERRLERYPFRRAAYLAPDYVIRYQTLGQDLALLLRAFNCSTKIGSRNVHSVENENEEESTEDEDGNEEDEDESEGGRESLAKTWELESEKFNFGVIPLTMNDRRHKQLLGYARRLNKAGLEKAMKFRYVGTGTNRREDKAPVSEETS